MRSYQRIRKLQSFESPPPTKKQKTTPKSHSPDFSSVTWDKEKVLEDLKRFPLAPPPINWQKCAREHNVPGRNCGQVVKQFAQQSGIDTFQLDNRAPATRSRSEKKKMPGGEISASANPPPSAVKGIEFTNYLQGVGDPGTRLLFTFRSGTNGLKEELGRHRGKNDDRQCKLCRGECESVVHVLWECPAYDSIRNNFMVELENLLGGEVWGV